MNVNNSVDLSMHSAEMAATMAIEAMQHATKTKLSDEQKDKMVIAIKMRCCEILIAELDADYGLNELKH